MTAMISRVEVVEYTFDVDNLGADRKHNRVYSKGARSTIGNFVVRITDSDGAVGEFAPGLGGKLPHLGQVLYVAPLLVGHPVDERERVFNDLKKVLRHFGGVGASHLDCALWDLFGRRCGKSVSALLGGYRRRLPAYASAIHADDNGGLHCKEAFVDFAEECYGLGFRAFKVHGWTDGDVQREIDNVLHLGRHFRGRMALMLDLGGEILTFATDPAHQKQGHGRRLIDHVITILRQDDQESVFLEVAVDNVAALALYTACGFEQVGLRKAYYARAGGAPVDGHMLRLALK